MLATLVGTGVEAAPWMDEARKALERRTKYAELAAPVRVEREGCYVGGCYVEVRATPADYQLLGSVMNTDPGTLWSGPSIVTAPESVGDELVVGLWILIPPEGRSGK